MRTLFDARRFAAPIVLGALLLVTRIGHFDDVLALADTSWAVFVLGGAFLGGARAFVGLCAIAGAADLAALELGQSSACVSPGYLALIPAYAVLFWAGRIGGHRSLLRVSAATVAGAVAAYAISNAGLFAFEPELRAMPLRVFASRVAPYLPAYLTTTLGYTLAGHFVAWAAAGPSRARAPVANAD